MSESNSTRSSASKAHRVALVGGVVLALVGASLQATVTAPAATAAGLTTAWQSGQFSVDVPNVVRRSNVVLGKPNAKPEESLPLGNGTLGVALWSAGGFTAQLNRGDTFPDRKSPGQVTIPGLAALTQAADYTASLDLYDGTFRASGGGMTVTAFVRADKDELVVDVTGASPTSTQTAKVSLWSGRTPSASASGSIGTLSETWVDNKPTTGSGQTFGSLATITAGGRNVVASTPDALSAQVSFTPQPDGSFRVIVASPGWTGGNASATASALLGSDAGATAAALRSAHLDWWHDFWATSGSMKLTSTDGSAEYIENIRAMYLYTNAAESGGTVPGSQAGVANLFTFSKDYQRWYPAAYWFWNLRMQVAANIGTGNFDQNLPVFDLYLDNLDEMKAWTIANMGGRPGICMPETMRYNGNGYQNDQNVLNAASCSIAASPTWNGLTVSSGTELSLWIWQQYLATGDLAFLTKYYPLIRESAVFLLDYIPVGSDGLRHAVANAHENQWAVQDPTTNIAAMTALFPVVVAASQKLNVDDALRATAQTAQAQIPPLPRTDIATRTQQLTAANDASGNTMFADSYQQSATKHNAENIGLEPVWPYSTVTDTSGTLFEVAKRSYTNRPNKNKTDWTMDAIQAARLGLASEVKAALVASTTKYQAYISGLNSFEGGVEQMPYIEQSGVLTTALNEALVQDYDGVLRIAPAWPSDWSVSGRVFVRGQTVVDVQVQNGTLTTVALEAGSTLTLQVRNPWPGQAVTVVDGSTGAAVVASTTDPQLAVAATAGHSYLVQQTAAPTSSYTFAPVTGTPATTAKHLGTRQIGLDAAGATAASGVQPLAGQVYGLQAVHSAQYADVASANAATSRPPVVQNVYSGTTSQRWQLTDVGSGRFSIKAISNGKCLDVNGASSAPGAAIIFWNCSGAVNQQWSFVATDDGSSYQLTSASSTLCLAVPGASSIAGTALVQSTCGSGTEQRWRFTAPLPGVGQPITLQANHSGKNLDSVSTPVQNPQPAAQKTASAAASQKWVLTSSGSGQFTVTSSSTGSCLDVAGGSTTKGAKVVTQPCSSASATQKWSFSPTSTGAAYSVRSVPSGLCIDVSGGSTADNAAVTLWTCSGSNNQLWKALP